MNLLKVEFPLSNGDPFSQCSRLVLFKDVKRDPLQPYTLRRVENLRRSVTDAMKRIGLSAEDSGLSKRSELSKNTG